MLSKFHRPCFLYLQIVLLQIIWSCLVEDSNLFFKYFMEQLTRDKSIETFQIVRKLIRFIPKLPQQAAFSLYNYIIGYIMFYVRHPREKGKGSSLTTLINFFSMCEHSHMTTSDSFWLFLTYLLKVKKI